MQMKSYIFLILGGVSAGLSVSFPVLWPLVFVSLLPLLNSLYKEGNSQRKLFFHGLVFGTALMASSLYWFFNTLPLAWLGISNPLHATLMVGSFWSILSILLGLAVAAWAILVRRLLTKTPLDLLIVPVSWVFFEYLRMWWYAVLAYGPGAILEPHFSFGFFGYSLAHSTWTLSLAQIGGVYFLSLVAAAVNVALLLFFKLKERRYSVVLLVVVVVLGVSLNLFQKEEKSVPLVIEAVAVNFRSALTIDAETVLIRQEVVKERIREIGKRNESVEVVILPESSNFIQNLGVVNAQEFFREVFGEREVLIIDSWRTETQEGALNKVVYFSSTQGVIKEQNKRFLIVFGEYMPTAGEILLRVAGRGEEVDILKKNRSYVATKDTAPFHFKGMKLATLVCSELVSPWLYHSIATKDKVDVLVNLSSLAWFHHGANPFNQLVAMAKIHAVWSGLPYIQATNADSSFSVSSLGSAED